MISALLCIMKLFFKKHKYPCYISNKILNDLFLCKGNVVYYLDISYKNIGDYNFIPLRHLKRIKQSLKSVTYPPSV